MNTAEQLDAIRVSLEAAEWQRVNGNTWHCLSGVHQIKTSYTYKEATLTLWCEGRTVSSYRGPHPLGWLGVWAVHVNDKNLATELAKQLDTESVPV